MYPSHKGSSKIVPADDILYVENPKTLPKPVTE